MTQAGLRGELYRSVTNHVCWLMKKTQPQAAEDARQRAMTIRLLFVVGALAGLLACVLVSRIL
jgi:hypothetical protein